MSEFEDDKSPKHFVWLCDSLSSFVQQLKIFKVVTLSFSEDKRPTKN